MMLPLATIQEIDRLLANGQLSQRKIAKQMGVSRGTVAAIADGRRGLFGRAPEDDVPQSLTPKGPPKRCGVCGFLIYEPCLICQAREFRQQQQAARARKAAAQTHFVRARVA